MMAMAPRSWKRSLFLVTALSLTPSVVQPFAVFTKYERQRQSIASPFSLVTATTTFIRRLQQQTTTLLGAESSKKTKYGDPIREATRIRPSLHPVTINAIAEALKIRAQNLPESPLRLVVSSERTKTAVEPLQIALVASKIAADAVKRRQEASLSTKDGMTLTAIEEQTIAGRVLGVVMRFDILESELRKRCAATPWIAKYGEWGAFGVVANEQEEEKDACAAVDERILQDPLFGMNRAECLLALFLQTVERVELEKIGESVPDNGVIDFLDADRSEVLLEFL